MTEVKDFNAVDDSNTLLGSINMQEGQTKIANGNDIGRALMGAVGRQLGKVNAQSSSIASASTTDLSNATGAYVAITGNTTINSFGTVAAGQVFYLVFSGVLTVTHNATSLILPGGVDRTTAAGDVMVVISNGSGNWRCISHETANGSASGSLDGTFTPSITGTGTAGSGTYGLRSGEYTKIGNRVWFTINLAWSAHTGVGNMNITGLPFANSTNLTPVALWYSSLTFAGPVVGQIGNGATSITLQTVATGAGAAALPLDTSASIYASGHYSLV